MRDNRNPEENRKRMTDLQTEERAIERGLSHFFAVGSALAKIHSQRLYRATHRTWEEYCSKRWGFGRRHAERLISAAEVINLLRADRSQLGTTVQTGPIGPVQAPGCPDFHSEDLPQNEAQARELGRVVQAGATKEELQKLWDNIRGRAKPGQPTAEQCQTAADRFVAACKAEKDAEQRLIEEEERHARPDERMRRFMRIRRVVDMGVKPARLLAKAGDKRGIRLLALFDQMEAELRDEGV